MSGFQRLMKAMLLGLTLISPSWARTEPPVDKEGDPDMAMLEFLGSFEDKEAGWVDPFALATMEQEQAGQKEDGHEKK